MKLRQAKWGGHDLQPGHSWFKPRTFHLWVRLSTSQFATGLFTSLAIRVKDASAILANMH